MNASWITITCNIDGCGAVIGAKNSAEAKREITRHRKSFHPGWRPPPDKRRAPRLD